MFRQIYTLLFLSVVASAAEPVRVSFLADTRILADTLKVLKSCGCTPGASRRFQIAVQRYHSTFQGFDFTRFPNMIDGFYRFDSAGAVLSFDWTATSEATWLRGSPGCSEDQVGSATPITL